MCMCCFGKPLDIKYHERGIGNRLAEDRFGVGLECRFQFLIAAVGIHESKIDPHAAHGHIKEVVGASVNSRGCDHMITASGDIENSKEVCRLTGRSQHAGSAAFQCRDLGRNIVAGGVLKPCIEVTGRLQIKQLSHILAGIVLERSALHDRREPGFSVFGHISCLYT